MEGGAGGIGPDYPESRTRKMIASCLAPEGGVCCAYRSVSGASGYNAEI